MTKILMVVAAIIILGGGGWYIASQKTDTADVMVEEEAMMEEEGSIMEGEMMSAHGTYEAYAPEKLVLAEEGDVLLFFHADWCPTCRGLEAEIEKDISVLPEGLHILKIDYDSATALKQQYGVTTQSTFVQVDAEGALIQKFSDEQKIAGVVARVK
jgi:thiol-disulfide isomerase/thioredoxin